MMQFWLDRVETDTVLMIEATAPHLGPFAWGFCPVCLRVRRRRLGDATACDHYRSRNGGLYRSMEERSCFLVPLDDLAYEEVTAMEAALALGGLDAVLDILEKLNPGRFDWYMVNVRYLDPLTR